MNCTPEALFDCLSIIQELEETVGGVTDSEVHLFAYLACILSIYDGSTADEWGYGFAVTDHGRPFSSEVQVSLDTAMRLGYFRVNDGLLNISDIGRDLLQMLQGSDRYQIRKNALAAASNVTLALPIGAIRSALLSNPDLKNAAQLDQEKLLLSGSSDSLYDSLSQLSAAVGMEFTDLFIPAVTWLDGLFQTQNTR